MIFHGSPSGLDHTVATTGQCLRFIRTDSPRFHPVDLTCSLPLVVLDTARWNHRRCRFRRQGYDADFRLEYDRIFEQIGALCDSGVEALQLGDLNRVGGLFDDNQNLLRRIGVSSQANEEMLQVAHVHGVLGAKLTGAGHGGADHRALSRTPN